MTQQFSVSDSYMFHYVPMRARRRRILKRIDFYCSVFILVIKYEFYCSQSEFIFNVKLAYLSKYRYLLHSLYEIFHYSNN